MLLPYYRISKEPYIFVSILDTGDSNITERVFKNIKKSGSAYLFLYWSSINNIELYTDLYKRLLKYTHIDITILCGTKVDVQIMEDIGYRAIFCSPSAFVSESIFTMRDISKQEKKYNAIYTSQVAPYKRLELAHKIDKLGIIAFVNPNSPDTKEYRHKMIELLSIDSFINLRKALYPRKVCEILNYAKCGLALSKEEGAMYAVVEYLLCGIPVITTENIGGRDEFLDDNNSIYVKDDSVEIGQIVNNLDGTLFDSMQIRSRVIEKMQAHRNYLFTDLHSRFGNVWEKGYRFTHKLLEYHDEERIA